MFGTTVVTAITAQNTLGVSAWTAVDTTLIRAQIDAVARDLRPAAVKSGMLADTAVVNEVAEGLKRHSLTPYILDPVMVATSGDLLLDKSAVESIRRQLMPLAACVTPNLYEAAILTGSAVEDVGGMERAAKWMVEEGGAASALVKGGHLDTTELVDVLYDGADGKVHHFRHDRVDTSSTHGTGCTLSSAIAAHMARGLGLHEAVSASLDYVHRAIASAPRLGSGHGPLNHWA